DAVSLDSKAPNRKDTALTAPFFGHSLATICTSRTVHKEQQRSDPMAASTAAFGVFSDRISTENAIETLMAAGFRNTDILALFPDEIPTKKSSRHKRREGCRTR